MTSTDHAHVDDGSDPGNCKTCHFYHADRTLADIAAEISTSWMNPSYSAVPYIAAMRHLGSVHDNNGYDSAEEIVLHFLGNARSWHGDTARRIKSELRSLL